MDLRQIIDVGQQRTEQLMQAGERQLRLGLHPNAAQHPAASAPRRNLCGPQEAGLAYAGLPENHHHRPDVAVASDLRSKNTDLVVSSDEPRISHHGVPALGTVDLPHHSSPVRRTVRRDPPGGLQSPD